MNYIAQINAFWERQGPESGLKSTAALVYLALLQINNRCGWKTHFNATFNEVLNMAGIANDKTYYLALKQLVTQGYITYEKGPNQFKAAVFSIKVLYQKTEEQGSSKEGAAIPATEEHIRSRGDIPKPLNKKQLNTKQKVFVRPEIKDVIHFFLENGYTEQSAIKAYQHYHLAEWTDTSGKPVLNWKQKMNSNWFKDENKIKSAQKLKLQF